jgi:protein ImuB
MKALRASALRGAAPQHPVASVQTALQLERAAPAAATAAAQLWAALHLRECPGERLQALAQCLLRFTPRISLEPPDGLVLEVKGSLHLFGGVPGIQAGLLQECRRLGLSPCVAFAPTPLAALAVARSGKTLLILTHAELTGQLASLPLTVLRWPEKTLERLKRLGVRNLGAALRLPRVGFARRFGPAQLAMLDALTARSAPVRANFRPRERFRRRRELEFESSQHAALLMTLTPLVEELAAFLRARQYAVVELECRLLHRQAPPTRCVLGLAAPCAEAARLTHLMGERLAALTLPEAVRACELRAHALVVHAAGARCLWQPGEQGGEVSVEGSGLIERLRARLGPEAVHGLALLDGHRPESSWALTAAPQARAAAPRAACGVDGRRRPLWILPAPQPLAMQAGRPRRGGPLRLVSEPERIETGWWDGGEIARDYYTALDNCGVRLWVYRERSAPHGWYLHGVFG